jgi:hypothetical protein
MNEKNEKLTEEKGEEKKMNAVISLEKARLQLQENMSRKEELRNFFNLNVLDYAELSEDKSGVDEFENAFIKNDDVTKRSKK